MVGTLERSTASLTGLPPSDMKTHNIYSNRYKNNARPHLKENEVVGAGERTSYCSFTVVLQDITTGEAGAPGFLCVLPRHVTVHRGSRSKLDFERDNRLGPRAPALLPVFSLSTPCCGKLGSP